MKALGFVLQSEGSGKSQRPLAAGTHPACSFQSSSRMREDADQIKTADRERPDDLCCRTVQCGHQGEHSEVPQGLCLKHCLLSIRKMFVIGCQGEGRLGII